MQFQLIGININKYIQQIHHPLNAHRPHAHTHTRTLISTNTSSNTDKHTHAHTCTQVTHEEVAGNISYFYVCAKQQHLSTCMYMLIRLI